MIILGIDPGLDGGLALLDGARLIEVVTMPTLPLGKSKRALDTSTIWDAIDAADHVIIEAPQVRPKQSAQSGLTTGRNFGLLEGLIVGSGNPYSVVAPQTWTKAMHAGVGKAAGDSKGRSLLVAKRLFPSENWLPTERSKKPHDGMIDAALIARYGMLTLTGGK